MPHKLLSLFVTLAFFISTWAFAAVNLNTASQSELEALPGVGSATASNIMHARPFHSVDELKNVKGIGATKFAALSPLVEVGSEAKPSVREKMAMPNKARTSGDNSARPMTPAKNALAANDVININTASQQELERLPGIGPAKAEAIIQARPFSKTEDLMKVRGIKEKTFAKIRNNVTVD